MVRLNHDKEVRREFMVLSTRLHDARMIGKEEGREEKAQEVVINMLKKNLNLSTIVECTNISEAEIRLIAQENGLSISSAMAE